jgi:hypothetical protein
MHSITSFVDHTPTGTRRLFTLLRRTLGNIANAIWGKASTIDYLGEVGGF